MGNGTTEAATPDAAWALGCVSGTPEAATRDAVWAIGCRKTDAPEDELDSECV